jgi:hypothetical protein
VEVVELIQELVVLLDLAVVEQEQEAQDQELIVEKQGQPTPAVAVVVEEDLEDLLEVVEQVDQES